MSQHKQDYDFSVFPTPIASALTRAFGSYLVPNGAAVRHPNGFQEILVSFPKLDETYPEHYPLYTEGFRERESVVYERVQIEEAPIQTPEPLAAPVNVPEEPINYDPAPVAAEPEPTPEPEQAPEAPQTTPEATEAPATPAPTEVKKTTRKKGVVAAVVAPVVEATVEVAPAEDKPAE